MKGKKLPPLLSLPDKRATSNPLRSVCACRRSGLSVQPRFGYQYKIEPSIIGKFQFGPWPGKIYPGVDAGISVSHLRDAATGLVINDATLTANVTLAATGATVAGGVNIPVSYVPASNGDYSGTFPRSPGAELNRTYQFVLTSDDGRLTVTENLYGSNPPPTPGPCDCC